VDKNTRALCVKIISLLKRERERRKLSKYFIAQESGLSPQMIAYVENGDRNPTLETLLRMAQAMDVDLAKIIVKARKQLSRPAKGS
jgi:transcriptional regulator with XRE-family HTH domain